MDVLRAGTARARELTAATQAEVHAGLGLLPGLPQSVIVLSLRPGNFIQVSEASRRN